MSLVSRMSVMLFFAALGACSSARRVELRSDPVGATIKNSKGDKIGETPLTLQDSALDGVVEGGVLFVKVENAGYVPQYLALSYQGRDEHTVTLEKFTPDYFRDQVLPGNQPAVNRLARDILNVQQLVAARKLDDAERAVLEFQKNYPVVAYGYVMQGNLELLKKNATAARRAFVRANQLDPEDPVVARLAKTTDKGATDKPSEPLVVKPADKQADKAAAKPASAPSVAAPPVAPAAVPAAAPVVAPAAAPVAVPAAAPVAAPAAAPAAAPSAGSEDFE